MSCFLGTVEAAIATAKNLGHKLNRADCVMEEPARTKLNSPSPPAKKVFLKWK